MFNNKSHRYRTDRRQPYNKIFYEDRRRYVFLVTNKPSINKDFFYLVSDFRFLKLNKHDLQ